MRVISWGDFPTWTLAVIALLALIAAVGAYFKQADAAKKLAEQVTIQRDQFQDQQKVNEKQIHVMDAQLFDMQRRTEAIERQQADAVTLSAEQWRGELPGYEDEPRPWRMALVGNGSHRPIRDVACHVRPVPENKVYEPATIAQIMKTDGKSLEESAVVDSLGQTEFGLMAAGDIGAFIFSVVVDVFFEDALTLRFTDDAGVHWQIDQDLHLQKLENRDDW